MVDLPALSRRTINGIPEVDRSGSGIVTASGSPNGPTGRTTPCHIAKLFSLRTALALYEKHGYSPAIRSGDLLFVSGQVGSLSDGTPEHDYEAQVRLAYENLKATLAGRGMHF